MNDPEEKNSLKTQTLDVTLYLKATLCYLVTLAWEKTFEWWQQAASKRLRILLEFSPNLLMMTPKIIGQEGISLLCTYTKYFMTNVQQRSQDEYILILLTKPQIWLKSTQIYEKRWKLRRQKFIGHRKKCIRILFRNFEILDKVMQFL